ncbi:response regulator [Aphanothece hegewaldii CCALA 016]|uniref:Protein PatA n=1 Tax=Aphanothece hegewaldii CCALA 016 TaxID=2107694 RepID=A0A2T1LVV8_9CHRO|nr:response regulator [Aphanothece hegewaldii]PSF35987.1 response regulator [Aphanothece hegewaldii CCALA 016]
MQGNLNEIDIRSILQLIELGQRTGELYIQKTNLPSLSPLKDFNEKFWYLFFVGGQIVYAADQSNNSLLRLRDYLQPYREQKQAELDQLSWNATTTLNTPEYSYLWCLLEKNILTPEQGRKILQKMVEESLFDLFSLLYGSFIFEMASPLAPQLTAIEIAPLVTKTIRQVQQIKQLYPVIQHPDQYFIIANEKQLRGRVPPKAYLTLARWSEQKITLRQLFRYLNRDLLAIALVLYPYAERGWIQFVNKEPQHQTSQVKPKKTDKSLHIVCIDDDLTIGKSIELILAQYPYKFTLITDPLQSLSQIFQIQPDLILCDIAMPKLEGYEICGMLRQSSAFRQTPIIMLTGKEGLIDRVKARMAGATDYLTKPFGASELVLLLEKYTHSPITALY